MSNAEQPEWESFDNLVSVYANRVMALFNGNEFILVFGELLPADIPGVKGEHKNPTIKPFAKIVIPLGSMQILYSAISSLLQLLEKQNGYGD